MRNPGRDRHRHGPVPHRWAPGLLGQVRPRCQGIRREEERQRHDRAWQPLPGPVLGNAAASIARTGTFLEERYRRIARRRGSQKAVVAIGRSLLIIIWHLLAGPPPAVPTWAAISTTPGSAPERRKRNHIRQLEALGYKVTLESAA